MKNSQLNRVVRLISHTNDKAIVLDQETEEVVVMLPLDNYEKMVGVFDEPFDMPPADDFFAGDMHTGEEVDTLASADQTDSTSTIEEPMSFDNEFSAEAETEIEPEQQYFGQDKPKNNFSIPPERLQFSEGWAQGNAASAIESEEKLDDLPHDEEEEKFYLEPVE